MSTLERRFRPFPSWIPQAIALLAVPTAGLAAEKYFGYAEGHIEVTAAGTDAYAVNLAHSCLRLDAMLRQILGITTSHRVPTYIYALPHREFKRYVKGDYSSAFRISRLGDSVIVDASVLSNGREYYPANFGCVSSLLESDNKYKGPRWYTQGLPEVFADVVFDGPHATIGGILPQYAWTLSRGGFIPMRTFLKLSVQEEEQGHYFPHLYAAESWYLARQIFVEGKHRSEFNHYLGMLRTGVVEAAAFAASFSLSYEDLDKELVGDMRHSARAYVVDFAEPAAPAGSRSAVALNAAEVQGRLALLSVRCERGPDGPDAVQLAGEALRTDPGNESALRALALAQLERKAYGEALSAAERLPGALASPAAYDDRADVLAGVAAAAGTAVAATEVATLRTRASQDYNAALAAVPDDRRAQNGLERLSAAH